jgi:hypothetical protein
MEIEVLALVTILILGFGGLIKVGAVGSNVK